MELQTLREQFIEDHQIGELHLLHSLILDECCETAIRLGKPDYATLSTAVSVAFLTCFSSLRSVIDEGLRTYDQVKIVYRGHQFTFQSTDDPALDSSGISFIRHEN